jgi:hypothetical protein
MAHNNARLRESLERHGQANDKLVVEVSALKSDNARLREDSKLLDALLSPAFHPPPSGWPYPDTRGRYDPPTIVQFRANDCDGMPERVSSPTTREELRVAIARAARAGEGAK